MKNLLFLIYQNNYRKHSQKQLEMEEETLLSSYLSFKLGDELFAANVSKVLNILELSKITKVPQAPEYMKGVINLRG